MFSLVHLSLREKRFDARQVGSIRDVLGPLQTLHPDHLVTEVHRNTRALKDALVADDFDLRSFFRGGVMQVKHHPPHGRRGVRHAHHEEQVSPIGDELRNAFDARSVFVHLNPRAVLIGSKDLVAVHAEFHASPVPDDGFRSLNCLNPFPD